MSPTSIALELAESRAAQFADRTALCIKEGGAWQELTYAELSRCARTLAAYLIESGLEAGDRAAILSESRPEWGIAFFGIVRAGAIVVPLDPKLGEIELATILADCAPKFLFVSAATKETAERLKARIPALAGLIALESRAAGPSCPWIAALAPRAAHLPRERRPGATVVIVYTSGTTGDPKGVMITDSNLVFEATRLEQVIDIGPGEAMLSILPLNHLLELTGGFLAILNQGGTVCYARSLFPQDLAELMRERSVKAMIGVPLLFKSLRGSLEREIRRAPLASRLAFHCAALAAAFVPWRGARRLLFRSLHRRLGGRLQFFVSGGAPLDPEEARFFDRLGLPILQGYGLTESSPVISVNTLKANKIGSVGRPLAQVEVMIDAAVALEDASVVGDGEILTRGPHVMSGYYRREDLTRAVIDPQGWLHTGDMGSLDADGFLYITGRLRNLIVLGSGKKVYPEEVEAVLARSPSFREVCVLGRPSSGPVTEGGEVVCAVVVPATGAPKDAEGTVDKSLEAEVHHMSLDLAAYKRPTHVFIHPAELPKTASGKVKRLLIKQWLERQELERRERENHKRESEHAG